MRPNFLHPAASQGKREREIAVWNFWAVEGRKIISAARRACELQVEVIYRLELVDWVDEAE